MTTDQIIKRHPWIDCFSAATYLLLGGGGYKSMRALVTAAKKTKRDAWKENAAYDHRTGMWFDKTTGSR